MTNRPTGCVILGAALKAARKARGLHQSDLGERIGTDRSRIAQWERAHRAIRPGDLKAVEAALLIEVQGVNRDSYSAHHYRVCKHDLAAGPLVVRDSRSREVLYPVTREENAA